MRPNAQAGTFRKSHTSRELLYCHPLLVLPPPSLRDRQFPPNAQRAAKTDRQPDCEHPTRHYPRKPWVLNASEELQIIAVT
jgi:hypothetical protein